MRRKEEKRRKMEIVVRFCTATGDKSDSFEALERVRFQDITKTRTSDRSNAMRPRNTEEIA